MSSSSSKRLCIAQIQIGQKLKKDEPLDPNFPPCDSLPSALGNPTTPFDLRVSYSPVEAQPGSLQFSLEHSIMREDTIT